MESSLATGSSSAMGLFSAMGSSSAMESSLATESSSATASFLAINPRFELYSILEESMAILGKHCKAFPLSRLRQFPGWTEKPENARPIKREVNGEIVEEPRKLSDADYVYVQRNFTVTDSIFIDENIIFSDVTDEWIDYCRTVLGLEN